MAQVSSASPFDHLPLFATDLEIAEAIVGKERAAKWVKERMPALVKVPGWPEVDEFHGGRPVPLVRLFYNNWMGMPTGGAIGLPRGRERPEAWGKSRRKAVTR
jgi:hypothetical protein